MASIKISRIISVSSEDPKHPACTLLKPEGISCWKCKDPGVKNAILILELAEDSVINSVDVGNEHSALIEVLVAKSADPDNFQVLIIATSLMTVQESRNSFNKNAVKFFKYGQLMKPTADESWNRIKIICSQPFNCSVQYGLSFIKFHSKSVADKPASTNNISLGKYSLKTVDESDISVGSLFLKRKEPSLSLSALTKSTSSNIISKIPDKNQGQLPKSINNHGQKRKTDDDPIIRNRKAIGGSLLYGKSSDENSDDSSKSVGPTTSVGATISKKSNSKFSKVSSNVLSMSKINSSSPSSSAAVVNSLAVSSKINRNNKSGPSTVASKPQKGPKRKPFNKLFENVVIVISGYQNPYRSELRSKAVQMGAKYKTNWDSTCTHLLCAFMNTPKYHQVRGHGHIVTKDWIQDSHNQRKRLPWKRYALNKNDVKDTDSDEEIWEEDERRDIDDAVENLQQNIQKIKEDDENGMNEDRISDSGSDTEDEIERVRMRQRKTNLNPLPKNSIYDMDTDVEDEKPGTSASDSTTTYGVNVRTNRNSSNSIPYIPEFFEDLAFYVDADLPESVKKTLWRYIIAHSGTTTDEVLTADYTISEKSTMKNNRKPKIVKPQWVLDCHDSSRLLPVE